MTASSPLKHTHSIRSVAVEIPSNHKHGSNLLALPSEILDQILDYLAPSDLAHTCQVSRRFAQLVNRDPLWESRVQENVPKPLVSSSPYRSFRDLYKAHSPYWFLTRHRLWLSDSYPHGKLLIARYDPRSGGIEAYALIGHPDPSRNNVRILRWGERDVVYRTFHPLLQLDLNQPVVRLMPDKIPLAGGGGDSQSSDKKAEAAFAGTRFQVETPMQIPSLLRTYVDHLHRTFMHTKVLPSSLCDSRTSLWPPMSIPAPGNCRTRASSNSSYTSSGHKPASLADASTTSFRLRQRLNFHPFTPLQSIFSSSANDLDSLMGDQVDTFGAIDPAAYTPTAEKPWQGIYVGDYSTHGCEFLLVTQPDAQDARPLPSKARRALQRWPHSTQWQALMADVPGEEDELDDADLGDDDDRFNAETSLSAAMQLRRHRLSRGESLPEVFPMQNGNTQTSHRQQDTPISKDEPPFRGRIEAIKLTGDPNVPRGEITFVADDISTRGIAGYTKEPDFVESRPAAEGRLVDDQSPHPSGNSDRSSDLAQPSDEDLDFKGTRMVRSVGHICELTETGRRESYIPSQLIMISPGKLAQWWMPFQHISFYKRIDWGRFLNVE